MRRRPGQHPLSADLFHAATMGGDLQLLRLLRARGCPWSDSAWAGAALTGCEELLDWLREEGCPRPVSVRAMQGHSHAQFSQVRPHC